MIPKQNSHQFSKSDMQCRVNIDNRVEIYIIRDWKDVKNITFHSRFVLNIFLQLLISN